MSTNRRQFLSLLAFGIPMGVGATKQVASTAQSRGYFATN
jgi:hypothetical protein